jgi:hypothetical protein
MNKFFNQRKALLVVNKETNEQIAVLAPTPADKKPKASFRKGRLQSIKPKSFCAAGNIYNGIPEGRTFSHISNELL